MSLEILFADSVAEGEVVWKRKHSNTVTSLQSRSRSDHRRFSDQTMPAVEAIALMRTRRKTVAEKIIEDQAQLHPGYTFFRTEADEHLTQLTYINHVLKLLVGDNLSWKLTGNGRGFVKFLSDNDLLQLPHATFTDSKLHFKDDFLYGCDDAVIRTNRKKRTDEARLRFTDSAEGLYQTTTNCIVVNV